MSSPRPACSSRPGGGASPTAQVTSRRARPSARSVPGAAAPVSCPRPAGSRSTRRGTCSSPTTTTSESMSSPRPARSSRPGGGASPTARATLRPARPPARPVSGAAAPASCTGPKALRSTARVTCWSPTPTTTGSMSSPRPARSSRPGGGASPTGPFSLRRARPSARAVPRAAAPVSLLPQLGRGRRLG